MLQSDCFLTLHCTDVLLLVKCFNVITNFRIMDASFRPEIVFTQILHTVCLPI